MKSLCLYPPEVLALLDQGRATVIRAVKFSKGIVPSRFAGIQQICGRDAAVFLFPGYNYAACINSPFGSPGDRVCVKETWRETWSSGSQIHGYKTHVEYKATYDGQRDPRSLSFSVPMMRYGPRQMIKKRGNIWCSGVTMPQIFSRLTPTLKSLAVKRAAVFESEIVPQTAVFPIALWVVEWNRHNKGEYAWDANPRVWVAELELENKSQKAREKA